MLKIKTASGVSFHVFWYAVKGLNRAVGKSLLTDFPVFINDFNAEK